MKTKKLLQVAVHFAIFSLPVTFNACGQLSSFSPNTLSTTDSSTSETLGETLRFDRTEIPEATKSDLKISGSCQKGIPVSIKVDIQAPVSVPCPDGQFSYNAKLLGADGPKLIVATYYDSKARERSDSVTVYKDTAAPAVQILNAVAKDTYVIITGSCENSLPLSFGADIQSISVATCTNNMFQVSASLVAKSGARTLEIAQVDKAGNRGSATQAWNPDMTPPSLSLTSPAPNSYVGATATLAGVCEPGLSISVSGSALAQAQQLTCSAGTFSASVNVQASGTLIVSQVDASNNKAEASVSVTKDIVAPNLTVTSPTNSQTVTTSSVTVSGACESGLPVIVSGTGVGAQMQLTCANSAYSSSVVLSSGNGQKVIDVKQTDLAGNSSSLSRTITKSAPTSLLTIAQPAVGAASKATITMSGACDTGGVLSFSGDISTATNVTCANGSYSKSLTFSAAEGAKAVVVKQVLNSVETSASRNFVKDSIAPAVAITQPEEGSIITESNFTVVGTCESGLPVSISGAGLSSSVSANCTNGAFSASVTSSANDGSKAFAVAQTDAASNAASVSRSVVRDTAAPVLTITSPANNSSVKGTIILAGACETGLNVVLSGTGLTQSFTLSCSAGMFSQSVTLSNGDGAKAITAKQTDIAGNVATVNLSVTKDTAAPSLTIAAPAALSKAETGLTITGACETGLSVKASGSGVASTVTANCTALAYSIGIVFSTGDGAKTVTISQTDAAGNTTSIDRQFEKGTVVVPGAAFTAAKNVLNTYCTSCHKAGGSASYADFTLASESEFVDKGFVVAGQPNSSKMVFRMLYWKGTYMGAANMPMGSTTANFPQAAYDTIVNWISQMNLTGPVLASSFTCSDPTLKATSLSYTLTKVQYVNTLTDLFGATTVAKVSDLIGTVPTDSFVESTSRRGNAIGTASVEAYFNIAKSLSSIVVDDATLRANIFGACASNTAPAATCIDTYLGNFAKKILRRPLTTEETTFAKSIANRGGDYKTNLKVLMALHLQSPAFIWRVELGKTSQTSTTQTDLTPYEVASRISYMAADTTPDQGLLDAAAANQLSTADQVKAQVLRMLKTTAGRDKMKRTLLRWSLNDKAMDFSGLPAFPGININGLGAAMVDEASQYVDYMVYTQNASFKTLLTSQISFASNTSLANIYGHTAIASGGQPATFAGRRQGLLMRAPFFSVARTRTGIIRRGVDFQKRFLCNEIPSPTASIVDMRTDNELSFEEKLAYSNRDAIAHQTSNAVCMNCHRIINPTGFAFENLDPFGKIRTSESIFDLNNNVVRTLPVVTSGEVPLASGSSVTVADGYDLVSFVANSSEGTSCFSRNIFRTTFERREASEDNCQLDTVQKAVMNSSKSILDTYVELISNSNISVKKN